MRISYITPSIITPNSICAEYASRKNNIKTNISKTELSLSQMPSTKDYLSFTGGYSLDLAATVKNLDKLAAKNSSVYPKNIREWAGMILESGNKTKATLIDIHKKYFESLKKCATLDEVKQKFPEFAGVISDNEVEFSKQSFGAAVKAGESEYFDKNEDLALQILKLYYGDGFSLNDLKNYTGGKDIYWTMKKLNIPRQNSTYGYVLKFSDPEYNKRLTSEMTYKRRLALDAKAKAEGEPVYIPKGPLSKEHKEHISEGLKKYYRENPERLYGMSERMKDFYRQNPDKSEELTRVLNKAWNIFGADKIKQALSKFMKQKGIKSYDPEKNPAELSQEQSKLMKQFWGTNEWAKKSFSRNMEYAWKKIKEENEAYFTVRTVPEQIIKFVEKKAGVKKGTVNADTTYNPYLRTSSIDPISQELIMKYTNIDGLNNVLADTYQLAVLAVVGELSEMNLKHKPKDYKKLLDFAADIAKQNIQNAGSRSYRVQTTDEARLDFVKVAQVAAETRCQELIDIVNKAMDDGFEIAQTVHNFILK